MDEQGTIKWFNIKKGYGFIQRTGKPDLFIHINQWRGPTGTQPQEGEQVTFVEGQGKKGPEAQHVQPADDALKHPTQRDSRVSTSSTPPTVQPPASVFTSAYRFLNPYNFIRYLPQPTIDKNATNERVLLWRCPPPPHDRYVGLSGKITCEVENSTPLFVSDSHAIQKGENDHYTYRFFEYEGKPAIPASSLRGMVRSVFEIVTDSCLGVFDGRKLSEHFDSRRAPWLVPARVEKDGDKWLLRLLPGATRLQTETPGQLSPDGPQYAAWAAAYWPESPSKTLRAIPPKGFQLGKKQKELRDNFIQRTETTFRNPDNIQHGEACYALLRPFQHPHPKVRFWDVVEVRRERKDFPLNMQDSVIGGWLCITNQNIEAKHSERFFFPQDSNLIRELPEAVRKNYEALIADYQHRHARTVEKHQKGQKKDKEMALSRFIYDKAEAHLQGEELVYALLSGDEKSPTVEFIAPVAVPRITYQQSVADLLAHYMHILPCQEYDKLCPACRIFGWVNPDPPKNEPECITAYAGRVHLSHAHHLSDQGTLVDTPLAILSTPNPTTTQFYLLNKDGSPDAYVDYNIPDAQLRGRKIYRHHGQADPKEYTYQGKTLSDQHRTVRGAFKPGAKFEFTVEFENLMPVELNALLYALELEEGLFHRIGYAKPLGFGSVTVDVKSLTLLDWTTRLATIDSEAGWQIIEIQPEEIVARKTMFLDHMRDLYGVEEVNTLLSELRTLLSSPPEHLPIHYPRPTQILDIEDHPQFEWFVGNNKRVEQYPRGKTHYEPVVLPKAEEDTVGLPLVKVDGKPGR